MNPRVTAVALSASLLILVGASVGPASPPASVARLATIPIPGDERLVRIARDVIAAKVALNPDLASSVGLYDDAIVVPSYSPAAVARQDARFTADLAGLAKLETGPGKRWSVDERIDARWLRASAEIAHRQLTVEKLWTHRYGEYLEPVGDAFISLTAYAPERVDLRLKLAALIPGMLVEMQAEVASPTSRDVTTGLGLLDGLQVAIDQLPDGAEKAGATKAIASTRTAMAARVAPGAPALPEFAVIGADNYGWRLQNELLLPWTAKGLLARAESELTAVDAELSKLPAAAPAAPATPEQIAQATALDRDGFLQLYTGLVANNLAALRAMKILTVPADFPTMRARETPAALVPLTGDGGSMNPPPAFGPPSDGWWNVEHFHPEMSLADRTALITGVSAASTTGLGPYAAHEGVPGHHLQLSLLRGMDPIHTILQDGSAVEGWALYAEQLFEENGGYGTSDAAKAAMLRSYRVRIRRVYYDVNIESGTWTLQQAADWKAGTEAGKTDPDPDVLRAINWPTQLITYFAGKSQILALKEEVKAKEGASYSERAFNDALLAEGPIPIALIRAKMLRVPVPP